MNSLRDENYRLKMIINENSSANNNGNKAMDGNEMCDLIINKSPNKSLDKLIKELNNNNKKNLEISNSSDKDSDRLIKRIEECKSINNEIISQSFKDGEGKRVVVLIYYGDQQSKLDDILMVIYIDTHTCTQYC